MEEEEACQNSLVEAHDASSVAGLWVASSGEAWGACLAVVGALESAEGEVVEAFLVGAEVASPLVLTPKVLEDFACSSQVEVPVELGYLGGLKIKNKKKYAKCN